MKRMLTAIAVLGATTFGLAGQARADMSVTLGEPGFYGRIEIGESRPVLLYDRPVVIVAGPRRPPVYMRVPPGHAMRWERYCSLYDSCGVPVYFVDDDWYGRTYAPHYRDHHRGPHDEHGPGRGHGWGR